MIGTMISDLGMRTSGKQKKRWYLMECLGCKNHFEQAVDKAKRKTSTGRCMKCSRVHLAELQVEKYRNIFKDKATNTHHGLYSYDKVDYQGNRVAITITCHKHGDFIQKPHTHLRGAGCPLCKGGIAHTEEEFIKSLDDGYSLKTSYINTQSKVTIHHDGCNSDYDVLPGSYNTGSRCPNCSRIGFSPLKPAILYYFKVWNEEGDIAYKIGITNRTVQLRYKDEGCRSRMEVIKVWKFKLGSEAMDIERNIKHTYKHFKYYGKPMFNHTGNTELYSKNILEL